MKKILLIIILTITFSINSLASVKLKDLVDVDGIRFNQLIGYGLVVGLNGTGDKSQTDFTVHTLVNMMDRMGITVDMKKVKVKNVAAVMVTAKFPAFAKAGTKADVVVSSIGDAKSIEGGTLLMTPLSAPDGEIYAVAQGPISVGGMNVSAGGAGVVKNHPTVGRIPNGAVIEKEIAYQLPTNIITISFKNVSISNVVKTKNIINKIFRQKLAAVASPRTVKIRVPEEYADNYYDFLDMIMKIEIEPETYAKVIVDERTGTIVMGSDVRISTVAVSHGNLTIKITSTVEISQPGPFSRVGETKKVENKEIEVKEEDANLMIVPEGVMLSDLVKALNSLGVTPRDLIAILQSIKAAGALQGELEII
jgi:flagellar P-ring protein precursor FlgI